MGSLDTPRKRTMAILSYIQQQKDTLFNWSNIPEQSAAWSTVAFYAFISSVSCERIPNYMRDIWWPIMREKTLAKLEESKKPGGFKKFARSWNDIDELVVNIMENANPDECEQREKYKNGIKNQLLKRKAKLEEKLKKIQAYKTLLEELEPQSELDTSSEESQMSQKLKYRRRSL